MAKRPTPKRHKSKSATRTRHSAYVNDEVLRLIGRVQSPYAAPAAPKKKGDKALKKVTRIKA
jgi:hypothetical protein